jgi:hypothetical protein
MVCVAVAYSGDDQCDGHSRQVQGHCEAGGADVLGRRSPQHQVAG